MNESAWGITVPKPIYEFLDGIHRFTLDAAAEPANARCPKFLTQAKDGLKERWTSSTWCYPPEEYAGIWVDKAIKEARLGVTSVLYIPYTPYELHMWKVCRYASKSWLFLGDRDTMRTHQPMMAVRFTGGIGVGGVGGVDFVQINGSTEGGDYDDQE